MKKIGFIDYYISEWHANNYPGWMKEICRELKLDYDICYAWAEKYESEVDGRDTDTWCRDFGVKKCDTIQELCEKCDNIVILAPSNPEKHLGYIEEAFKCGKRIYVDKTFAPDFATAKKIFEISEKYNTPFFSTSALRYGEELDIFQGEKNISVKGGGSNLPEYIIHQVEMAVKVLGTGAEKLMLTEEDGQIVTTLLYSDERCAKLYYKNSNGFEIARGEGMENATAITSPFFMNLMRKILIFFETGEVDFCPSQTLEVMKIREAIIKAQDTPDQWIDLLNGENI